jgi:hypothetical protein
MADLRNKLRKLLEAERHRAFMAKNYPPERSREPIRCHCGNSYLNVPLMWQIDEGGWPRKTGIYCPACIPAHLIGCVVMDAANLPDEA